MTRLVQHLLKSGWRRYVLFVLIARVAGYSAQGGEPAVAVATVTAGFVTAITVISGGSGYLNEPAVTVVGGGGNGSTARAILNGERVAQVVLTAAGSGYSTAPTVTIDGPLDSLMIQLELVPKLTVAGAAGGSARVEWSENLTGPWTKWTNLLIGTNGRVLVDLTPTVASRFFRAGRIEALAGPAEFVWIPPGTFMMGSPSSEGGRRPDEVEHRVILSQGFWMSDHEVTQQEFRSVMGGNPSLFRGDTLPVEQVRWSLANEYCRRLTERERAAGRITMEEVYRLPTEAEWEYAARAGTTGPVHGNLDSVAWHEGNSSGRTHVVKQKQPNAWGLYDVIGNVFEWCSDWHGPYDPEKILNPSGARFDSATTWAKVSRGGSYKWDPSVWCRLAVRNTDEPTDIEENVGLRVLLGAPIAP